MRRHWFDPDHHGTRQSLSGDLPHLPPCDADEEDDWEAKATPDWRKWVYVSAIGTVVLGLVAVLVVAAVLAGRSG